MTNIKGVFPSFVQLFLAELADLQLLSPVTSDWSLGMSTLGKADGPAISELKWVLYVIETFKGVLNAAFKPTGKAYQMQGQCGIAPVVWLIKQRTLQKVGYQGPQKHCTTLHCIQHPF